MSPSAIATRGYFVAGLLLAVGGVVCFSIRPIFIKLAYAYVVDPVTLLALRMIFSLPFFVGAAIWVRSGGGAPAAGGPRSRGGLRARRA